MTEPSAPATQLEPARGDQASPSCARYAPPTCDKIENGGTVMKFVQLIEFKTGDIDAFNRTLDEWLAKTEGARTSSRAIQGRDRDNDRTYFSIVEFPSYEAAMENSNRPETAEFAAQLAKICDGPPTFRNLDVTREEI
jgi:quinol monooxygenase YgiN